MIDDYAARLLDDLLAAGVTPCPDTIRELAAAWVAYADAGNGPERALRLAVLDVMYDANSQMRKSTWTA